MSIPEGSLSRSAHPWQRIFTGLQAGTNSETDTTHDENPHSSCPANAIPLDWPHTGTFEQCDFKSVVSPL